MEIVKKFDFEMAHIVRNAWSKRCSHSIHGHTYTAEIFLTRISESEDVCDAGQMIVDFGLVKRYIHPLIDSFDHATMLWNRGQDKHLLEFFTKNFDRVVTCDESSSCETMSLLFLIAINMMFDVLAEETGLENVPYGYFKGVQCTKVIIHETKSGRAECGFDGHTSEWVRRLGGIEDVKQIVRNIRFSGGIREEWSEEFKTIWSKV